MAWEITDADDENTLYTAGCDNPNSYGICEGGGNGTFEVCLNDGLYSFYGYDAFGDGWNGGTATFYDADGNVAGGPFTFEDSNFFPYGWGMGWTFCMGEGQSNIFYGVLTREDEKYKVWFCNLQFF